VSLPVYELKPDGTLLAQELALVYVQYPYRKTKDLYLSMKDKPVACMQCEPSATVEGTDANVADEDRLLALIAHIRSHDRRKKIRELARAGSPEAEAQGQR